MSKSGGLFMNQFVTRVRLGRGVIAAFCLLVVSIAVAGSAGGASGPQGTASASVKKQMRQLKRQMKQLKKQVTQLKQGVDAERGSPRPPSGPAGSGLTGSYPNPPT